MYILSHAPNKCLKIMTNQNVPLINTKYFKTILITNCIMFFKHEIWQN